MMEDSIQEEGRQQRPVKLLCVTPFSWLYGEALSLLQLVTSLDPREFEPYVITTGEGPLVSRLQEANIPVRSIHMPYLSRRGKQSIDFATALLPVSIRLANLIRKEKYDLVYNNTLLNPYGALAAYLTGVPCVWHVREVGRISPLRSAFIRLTGYLSTRLVVVSRSVGELYDGHAKKKIRVVYNGIDCNFFNPDLFDYGLEREALSIGPGEPAIAIVARMHPSKHHLDVMQALHSRKDRWPRIHLLMVGDGPNEDDLRQSASDLGLQENVHFLGYQEDVRKSLAACDLLVLPSEHEAFGRAVVEAMAMGKPVIATRVGGLPEIITPDTGCLVPVGDVAGLARAIHYVIEDPARAREMGKRGRERALSHFSLERYVDGMRMVFSELI